MNTVRIVKENDLAQIAKIHKQQLADHYLGNFSEKLLLKFYESFYNDKDIVFIVYEDQIGIRGFIVGGNLHRINNASSYFIKNNIPLYGAEIIIRPKTWLKSINKLVNVVFKKKPNPVSLDAVMDYTLLSIAVSKDAQGLGVASKMIDKFDEIMKEKSEDYFLSVHDTNDRALGFYYKKGFTKERHFDGEVQFVKKFR